MTLLSFDNDSWIQHVEYDTETKQMRITMKGGKKNIYECQGVSLDVYEEFEKAGSRGNFFNNNIKGKYNFEWFN